MASSTPTSAARAWGHGSYADAHAATATPADVARAVNAATRARGVPYSHYSCTLVSWDDAARSVHDGVLSSVGPNIVDTRLAARSGVPLWTLRSDNWNEKLGAVSARDIAVVVGSHEVGGALRPVTLSTFLASAGVFGAYAGLPSDANLLSPGLDNAVSVRVQVVFLPVAAPTPAPALAPASVSAPAPAPDTLEFATEAFSYQTQSEAQPRSMLLLCTTQGTAVQFSSVGRTKLFHHAAETPTTAGAYWLEAERSHHAVGGAQFESSADAAAAAARGKAVSCVLGVPGMGTRFNALMTVQVPLAQAPLERRFHGVLQGTLHAPLVPLAPAAGAGGLWGGASSEDEEGEECCYGCASPDLPSAGAAVSPYNGSTLGVHARRHAPPPARSSGESHAARVSRGTRVETVVPRAFERGFPKRDATQRMTATIVLYYTVEGGVPLAADVAAAVDDIEGIYASMRGGSGRLADAAFAHFTDTGAAPPPWPSVPTGRSAFPLV